MPARDGGDPDGAGGGDAVRRWTRRQVVREFMDGRSMVGLARKYGLTTLRVEAIIRAWRGR